MKNAEKELEVGIESKTEKKRLAAPPDDPKDFAKWLKDFIEYQKRKD